MALRTLEILGEMGIIERDSRLASDRNFGGFMKGLMAATAGFITTLAATKYIHDYTAPVKREESFITAENLVFAGGLTLSALTVVGTGYRYVRRQNRDESYYRDRLANLAMESTPL